MGGGNVQFSGKYRWVKHVDFMLIDLLTLLISYAIAYQTKFLENNVLNVRHYIYVLIIEQLVFLFASITTSIYSKVIIRGFLDEFKSSSILALDASITVIVLLYFCKLNPSYSREVFIKTFLIYIFLSTILKQIYKYALKKGWLKVAYNKQSNLIIVSTKENTNMVVRNVKDGDHLNTINILKEFCIDESSIWEIYTYATTHNVDDILFACEPSLIDEKVIWKLIDINISVHLAIQYIFDFYPENTYLAKVGSYHTLGLGLYVFSGKQLFYISIKRIFDLAFSLIGMACLFVLMIIVKIANLCTGDTGKLFYTQARVGKDGKEFQLYKFRSMYTNADEILTELLKDDKYKQEWNKYQKLENDPRITKVGNILRKTSLDEIPQFINIFKGEMSLVGPRPLIPGELEDHGGIKLYEQVKPGLTSWWAANGRSQINYDDRLDLEYYYVKNTSLWLDCKCIIKTIGCVLTRKGAE